MDDADRATPNIENMISDGIAKVRREMAESLPSIGVCHNCDSEVSHGRIFCSRECHFDHTQRAEARKRNGT